MLLNGIESNPSKNVTASQSLASLLSQSSVARSVAEQTAEAFKTPQWDKVSTHCKELL